MSTLQRSGHQLGFISACAAALACTSLVEDPPPVASALGAGTGLRAEYFDDIAFTQPKLVRVDPTVNFEWGRSAPDASLGADTFSARWSGEIEAPLSGSYTFTLRSDDGVRLRVNGALVVNDWSDHAPREASGSVTLTAGARYPISLEYYEKGGGAVAQLLWTVPGQARTVIPQDRLFPTASPPPEPGLSPKLPAATGACPAFTSGLATFAPAGIPARSVKLWIGAQGGGPLVFYWHGTGSSPDEARYGLGDPVISAVLAQGGVVAAPNKDPAAGTWPWFLVAGTRQDDLILADEIVACAVAQKNINPRRIHVTGMSAGGLQTSQMSLRRSNYVASAAPYSGGLGSYANPPYQYPANHLAALIFWGGTSDVVGIRFQDSSLRYSQVLRNNGNSTVLCNHGGGHRIPSGAGSSVWRFFQDHPFGVTPSPYAASGLPSTFPSYCSL